MIQNPSKGLINDLFHPFFLLFQSILEVISRVFGGFFDICKLFLKTSLNKIFSIFMSIIDIFSNLAQSLITQFYGFLNTIITKGIQQINQFFISNWQLVLGFMKEILMKMIDLMKFWLKGIFFK